MDFTMKKLLLFFFLLCLLFGSFSQNVKAYSRLGLGTGPHATIPLYILGTTEQFRSAYDGSNYLSLTIASDGDATFSVTGTNPNFNINASGTGDIKFNTNDFIIDTSSGDAIFEDNLQIDGGASESEIHNVTSDGSDNRGSYFSGGGSIGSARGSQVGVFGNEHVTFPGDLYLSTGAVASDIVLDVNHTSGNVLFVGTSGTVASMTNAGAWDINAGAIDGTTIGASSASSGAFTTGAFSGAITQTVGGSSTVTYNMVAGADNWKFAHVGTDNSLRIQYNTVNKLLIQADGDVEIPARSGTATSILGAASDDAIVDVTLGSGLSISGGSLDVDQGDYVENGGNTGSYTRILIKTIQIGDWDMDATSTLAVNHGLTLADIRTVSATIRSDATTVHHDFVAGEPTTISTEQTGNITRNATQVTLWRVAGGYFDDTTFNDGTSFNRGWITIIYEASAL